MSNITRYRGDTYADEFIIKNRTTRLPINITGYTFTLTVDPSKDPNDNSNNLFAITGTILNGPEGRVEFVPTEMQADNVGIFYYDVQMLDSSGRKRTIVSGKYKFSQDIGKI